MVAVVLCCCQILEDFLTISLLLPQAHQCLRKTEKSKGEDITEIELRSTTRRGSKIFKVRITLVLG